MCLAIPGKIVDINKDGYLIDYESKKVQVANSLINNVKLGDWVIVQNRFIINRLDIQDNDLFFSNLKVKEEK
ncbi:MAG: HypC/HybG/HupF family hydrogenase formation chaperone [Patescibacteria group bacterium]|jgi:hydrogenase expression/formation protein HypC